MLQSNVVITVHLAKIFCPFLQFTAIEHWNNSLYCRWWSGMCCLQRSLYIRWRGFKITLRTFISSRLCKTMARIGKCQCIFEAESYSIFIFYYALKTNGHLGAGSYRYWQLFYRHCLFDASTTKVLTTVISQESIRISNAIEAETSFTPYRWSFGSIAKFHGLTSCLHS